MSLEIQATDVIKVVIGGLLLVSWLWNYNPLTVQESQFHLTANRGGKTEKSPCTLLLLESNHCLFSRCRLFFSSARRTT